MTIRVLPNSLINQIAAGEVVERPANVVKELVENAIDAGADQIVIDVVDGGRTLISVIDNGNGMNREDLANSVKRHATSKLPDDDLLNINFMGFRGEALPSIASVSDMTIDTKLNEQRAKSKEQRANYDKNKVVSEANSLFADCSLLTAHSGYQLNCTTGEIRPSSWESGTRVRVENLFSKTPARLKFLRSDRVEMMSVVETVKRLAMARADIGFTLNDKWRFPKDQPLIERVAAVMGDDVKGRMIEVGVGAHNCAPSVANATDKIVSPCGEMGHNYVPLHIHGFISEPTLRRASSIDQYLFVNDRPVKDKVLIGALRAAYMDVMHAREFPLAALYLELPPREVDVNVSPSKTEVHFLEPARVRGFIIKTLRDALAAPLIKDEGRRMRDAGSSVSYFDKDFWNVRDRAEELLWDDVGADIICPVVAQPQEYGRAMPTPQNLRFCVDPGGAMGRIISAPTPLGRVIGQIGNKYILAEIETGLVIVDQHAAAERITYENLRKHEVKGQPLLFPEVINLKPEEVSAVLEVANELKNCGLLIEQFGEDALSIQERPADWDLNWKALLKSIADEVSANGHSSQLSEKLHLKLANYACHHSVRAGQKLSLESMDALLRDVENTERGGECNHGRPVYRFIPFAELDKMFERI